VACELSGLKKLFFYWKFHGICPRFIDRVHGCGSLWSTSFIKPWLLIRRSAVQIHPIESVRQDLILTIDFNVDGGTQLMVASDGARWRLAVARIGSHRSRPPGSTKCLSTRGLDLRERRIEGNSPRMVMCEGGDREVAHNGCLTLLSFDSDERLLLSSSGFKKWFKWSLVTSLCYLVTSMASRDGGSMKSQLA
jgi:hypothetical protein